MFFVSFVDNFWNICRLFFREDSSNCVDKSSDKVSDPLQSGRVHAKDTSITDNTNETIRVVDLNNKTTNTGTHCSFTIL